MEKWSDRLAFISFLITILNIVISTIAGLIAALGGGRLTELGSGAGGAYGLPDITNTLALALTLPALIFGISLLIRKKEGAMGRILVFVGALMISFGFLVIAHVLDPCLSGIWTSRSHLGDIPLCERFGFELNIHTRFHLLWHATSTLPLVLVYWYSMVKTYPQLFSAWRR